VGIILLVALTAILILAGAKWHKNQTRDNVMFFGFMVLLTSVLYSVIVLDIKIAAPNVSVERIEKVRNEVFATKQDIAQIAGLVIKSAFVLSDGSSRFGGTPSEHKAKLEEYARELTELTKQNRGELMSEVNRTIQELNDSIKKRLRGHK
jgi:hypothetical protein